jgi:transcriptional regulator with XRE-family HTH domain
MESTVLQTEGKPRATVANHSQRNLSIHAEAPPAQPMQQIPHGPLVTSSFSDVLAHAALHAELDHEEIAERMHISKGYMSRFMNGVAQNWAKRLIKFMRETNSLAPLQWMAEQMGCDVVLRDREAAKIAALEAQLAEMKRNKREYA